MKSFIKIKEPISGRVRNSMENSLSFVIRMKNGKMWSGISSIMKVRISGKPYARLRTSTENDFLIGME